MLEIQLDSKGGNGMEQSWKIGVLVPTVHWAHATAILSKSPACVPGLLQNFMKCEI